MSDLFTKVDIERLVRLFAAKLHEAGVEGPTAGSPQSVRPLEMVSGAHE